jgi:integrase
MTTKTTARRGRGEGTRPTKRPDGRWQARIRLPSGGRKSIYGATSDECARKLRNVIREIEDEGRPNDDRLTFGTYATKWIERSRPKLRERTHKRYGELLRLHAIPTLGRIPLSKLRADAIDGLLTSKGRALSPRTVHHLRAIIGRVLSAAVKERLIRVNEITATDPPFVPSRPVRATTPDEAFAILEAVTGHRYEGLVVTALWTGAREGELLALAWRDVDLDAGRVAIRRTLGLGRDAKGEPKFEQTKTKLSTRTLRIPAVAVATLREHRKRQLVERLAAGARWRDYDLVFATTIGTPLDPGDVLRAFHRVLAAAGIPRMRFHDLRHAYATLSLAAGDDLATIRDALGHSKITTTSDVYAHVLDRTKEQAADRLEAFVMASGS